MEFPDHTLANAQELAHGNFDGSHEATWFATNRYVAMTDGENTSGRSYEEFKQYYDGLREEKNQYRSLSFSSTRLMAASTRYSRGFVLTKIIPPAIAILRAFALGSNALHPCGNHGAKRIHYAECTEVS